MKSILMAVVMLFICGIATAAVTSGSAHYTDASSVNTLISGQFSAYSYEVNIKYDAGAYNYYILWDGSSAGTNAVNQMIASVVACGLVSEQTSWSSGYVVVGFLGSVNAWELSTYDARYILNNVDSRGGSWAQSYMVDHMTQIL